MEGTKILERLIKMNWQFAEISKIITENYRTKTFQLIPKEPLKFQPGNHIDVRLTSQNGYQTYLEFLNNLINFDLSKFSVLLDAANGSSYKIIEELFKSNNAKYRIISNNPDGENINLNCGATHLDNLTK